MPSRPTCSDWSTFIPRGRHAPHGGVLIGQPHLLRSDSSKLNPRETNANKTQTKREQNANKTRTKRETKQRETNANKREALIGPTSIPRGRSAVAMVTAGLVFDAVCGSRSIARVK